MWAWWTCCKERFIKALETNKLAGCICKYLVITPILLLAKNQGPVIPAGRNLEQTSRAIRQESRAQIIIALLLCRKFEH